MVYGEYVVGPQVKLAEETSQTISLRSYKAVYFLNSGSEAAEGAMKLAKKYTGIVSKIVAMRNAYHGSTSGALSMMSDEYYSCSFQASAAEYTTSQSLIISDSL